MSNEINDNYKHHEFTEESRILRDGESPLRYFGAHIARVQSMLEDLMVHHGDDVVKYGSLTVEHGQKLHNGYVYATSTFKLLVDFDRVHIVGVNEIDRGA
jgi:hypothetical protein